MAAANTDLVTEVGAPGTATTLASPGYVIGQGNITVGSTNNWPTVSGVVFAMDQVTTQTINGVSTQVRVAGTYTEWIGVVNGATGVISMQLLYGTDQNYPAGSTSRVYIPVSSNRENRLAQAIMQDHNRRGRHVQLTDTNGNKVLGLTPVASAVDDVIIANAAAGGTPSIGVEGTDTDIPLQLFSKGKGGLKVKGRADGWNDLSAFGTFAVAANNGQKEHLVNLPSDLSSFLQVGMKMAFDRVVTPPTQCMAFTAGSSQYATKASPTGISFTAAFTCEAWIYLTSYVQSVIMGREDSTNANGFQFWLNSAGQLNIQYMSAGATTIFQTSQSIPLNKWVHVAGVVTSVASKTGALYVNGATWPSALGTATATALTQSGNLTLGANAIGATPSNFFNGDMAEARIWSVAQSQASILANMAISLTGSETNLVALFQGNGNFNDKTANANNLTATNGPIATQTFATINGGTTQMPTFAPMNTTELGIITKLTSTQATLFTGTECNLPTAGTITNPRYSTDRAPAGFPTSKNKWRIECLFRSNVASAALTGGTWNNMVQLASFPTGDWLMGYNLTMENTRAAAGANTILTTLATANNSETDGRFSMFFGTSSGADQYGAIAAQGDVYNSALTPYYVNTWYDGAGGARTGVFMLGNAAQGRSTVWAECPYL